MSKPKLSIVVPTFREVSNISDLLLGIDSVMKQKRWSYTVEIVDDDSQDGTDEMVRALSHLPVKLHVRLGQRGLSSAVLHGLRAAKGEYLLVMDADGSHPPELIPQLVETLEKSRVDMVVGSRYVAGASIPSSWGPLCRLSSMVASAMAKPILPVSLSDPMSGFFAMPQHVFRRCRHFTPRGFKVGLELMVRCGCRRIKELPIHFKQRGGGRSKLSTRERFNYLEHLSRLYDFRFPRFSSAIKFLLVGLLGFLAVFALSFALASASVDSGSGLVTYLAAILVHAFFYYRYLSANRGLIDLAYPWLSFLVIAGFELATVAMYYSSFVGGLHTIHIAFACALGLVVRFAGRKVFGHDVRGPALFRRELEELAYEEERITCPACGSHHFYLPFFHSVEWLVKCRNCLFMFAQPQPSDDELSEIYDEHYFDEWGTGKNEAALKTMKVENFKRIVNECRKLRPVNKVLDVGCGKGYTVASGLEMGLDIYGIEPYSGGLVGLSSELRERIEECEMQDSKHTAEFDLVCLFDVIEHLRDPVHTLNQVKRFLRPGGIIVLTTIDADDSRAKSLGCHWFHIHRAHLWYFTQRSLNHIFAQSKVKPLCLTTGRKHYSLRFILGILESKAGPLLRYGARLGLMLLPGPLLDLILRPLPEGILGIVTPEESTGNVVNYLEV